MRVWLIVYHLGKIGGVWGPLPYTYDECLVRAGDLQAEVDVKGAGTVYAGALRVGCTRSDTRPELEEGSDDQQR